MTREGAIEVRVASYVAGGILVGTSTTGISRVVVQTCNRTGYYFTHARDSSAVLTCGLPCMKPASMSLSPGLEGVWLS